LKLLCQKLKNLMVRELYWDNPDVLWLKYEDFFNDFAFVFERLENFFDIRIEEGQRKLIEEDCSISRNKNRASRLLNFSEYDMEDSEIHGDHINKGEVGGWRTVIPENLHEIVNKKLEWTLKEWGYK